MNQDKVDAGVSPYTPKARKSIHDQNSHNSNCTHMGRYGAKSNRDNRSSPHHDQGVDVTDNVMSKCARQTSPKFMRLEKTQRNERRNSLSIEQYSDDDSADSDLLAKSLPATLPSYYCSDELFKNDNTSSCAETQSRSPNNRSNEYNNVNHFEKSTSTSFQNESQSRQGSQCSCLSIILTFIIGGISIIAAWHFGIPDTVQGTSSNYNGEFKFIKDMNDLGQKYKISDSSILEVQSGLSTILEKNDTGSFIFVYNTKSVNFDNLQFSNFMEDIASTAARYLRNSVFSKPTVIHSSELDMESHSELMSKYRMQVAKTGVMLVKDIDRIPSSLAMAFHYFCDEYNPLVAKSAIFFTLNLAKCSNFSEQKSTHYDVEKCLANKWNAVPKDNITPLLSRVVNVIIDVSEIS